MPNPQEDTSMPEQPTTLVTKPVLEPLLETADLKSLLRIGTRTLTRFIATGHIPPPMKVGSCNRWRLRDIQAYLERQEREREGRRGVTRGRAPDHAEAGAN
jgi:predicted DNA-binding transcriptional regulator AlpA